MLSQNKLHIEILNFTGTKRMWQQMVPTYGRAGDMDSPHRVRFSTGAVRETACCQSTRQWRVTAAQ